MSMIDTSTTAATAPTRATIVEIRGVSRSFGRKQDLIGRAARPVGHDDAQRFVGKILLCGSL